MTTTVSRGKSQIRLGDFVFSKLSTFAGASILVTLAAVAFFLFIQALPAFAPDAELGAQAPDGPLAYVAPYVFGTLYGAVIALLIATPLAIGIALYISHYAPRRFAQTLGYIIDLLAAIPSVVYGLWGILVLAPFLNPTYVWLNENLGWIPLFEGQVSATGRTMLTVGIVLAIMILPIMAAIIREVFLQTPKLHEEAALALGATRWEMIRMAVIPVQPHRLRQALRDFPVFQAVQRRHHLAHRLDASFGIGERAVLFQKCRTGQEDMRVICGLVQKQVVNDHAFHCRQPCRNMGGIGIGLQDVLALTIERLEHPVGCRVEHIRNAQSRFGIKADAPVSFE